MNPNLTAEEAALVRRMRDAYNEASDGGTRYPSATILSEDLHALYRSACLHSGHFAGKYLFLGKPVWKAWALQPPLPVDSISFAYDIPEPCRM
ncbi:MAG: hypothetical protein GY720_15850 [bacterium]|nr:hypothetical protein [bacterium]